MESFITSLLESILPLLLNIILSYLGIGTGTAI